MAALDFPSSPANNDEYTSNGLTWRYNTATTTWQSLGGIAGNNYALFDHYADAGNTGASETDLYSDTLAAGQFANNGDKIFATYAVRGAANTNGKVVKVYFGGTLIYTVTNTTISSAIWSINVFLIRKSSSEVIFRVDGSYTGFSTSPFIARGSVTGLTLTNTQILKITGTATATNDMIAESGTVTFTSAA